MTYKQDIHMKFDVPWLFLPESLAYFLTTHNNFFEDHNKGYHPLRKVKQFLKCSFKEIFSQRLTAPFYIWN